MIFEKLKIISFLQKCWKEWSIFILFKQKQ